MPQTTHRIFNFSAGPSTLPLPVLEQVRDELLDYQGTGMSVMEMSHRSKPFESIIQRAEADLRTLMGISDDYAVLFLQGGASLQFSMVPICFLGEGQAAAYVVTGSWGEKAVEASRLVGATEISFTDKANGYRSVPTENAISLPANPAYLHITTNETIQGVEFPDSWSATGAPLFVDMSSDILARPVDMGRYDLVYAGAQKNMGPAGATVIIVRKDHLDRIPAQMHPMLDYRVHANSQSLYNTPPCFSVYVCGLVYQHLLASGGVSSAFVRNQVKAGKVYGAIDRHVGFYKGHADERNRSLMNVTFTLPSEELTSLFVKESEARGLDGLKGHRSVGGIRASIYNAFPTEGCEVLATFMDEFVAKHG